MSQVVSRRERQKAETRAELVAAAHVLVKDEGYGGLTIRKLAERVGYAPMSVYSYFPDKHAILFALAQDAFAILARRMERDAPEEPLPALRKLMQEYCAFGRENPNEYETIFMTTGLVHDVGDEDDSLSQSKNPAMQLLLRRVTACVEAGIFMGDVHAISTMLWTFGHGTVALQISFPAYPFGERQAYSERVIDFVLSALRAAPVAPLGEERVGC